MTPAETLEFNALAQADKNQAVKRLVAETLGEYTCHDVLWTDGQVYTAFAIAKKDLRPPKKSTTEED
jgi:hypothetical protein